MPAIRPRIEILSDHEYDSFGFNLAEILGFVEASDGVRMEGFKVLGYGGDQSTAIFNRIRNRGLVEGGDWRTEDGGYCQYFHLSGYGKRILVSGLSEYMVQVDVRGPSKMTGKELEMMQKVGSKFYMRFGIDPVTDRKI
jgi:hypothetical protein